MALSMSRKAEAFCYFFLLLAAIAVLLSGCSQREGADALFVDYQDRVSTLLDIDAPTPQAPPNIAPLPSREERLFPLEETRLGMLDVYALRECNITSLVAERNSQLGKVAAASQRWLYDLELWRRLRHCWDTPLTHHLDAEDRDRLLQLTVIKTEQLPKASWNALFDSNEWVGSFSRASTALSPDEQAFSLADDLAALAYLQHAVLNQFNPAWRPDSHQLESHLYTLQQQPLTAKLLRGLVLASQRLDELSRVMEGRLEVRPICYKGHSNPRAEHLYNVFINTFIGKIQPYLAQLSRSSRAWLEAVNALLDAHLVSRQAITQYREDWLALDNVNAPWQQFQASTQRHIQLWQRIWRSCGMMPGEKEKDRA